MIQFISPLHRQYYLQRFYLCRIKRINDCSFDFDMFLRQCIARMSASRLSSSLSRSSRGPLYEWQYQMEFYTAAVSFLPTSVSIAPDVGAVSI